MALTLKKPLNEIGRARALRAALKRVGSVHTTGGSGGASLTLIFHDIPTCQAAYEALTLFNNGGEFAPEVTEADRLVRSMDTLNREKLAELLGHDLDDDEEPSAVEATHSGEWRHEASDRWRWWHDADGDGA